MSITTKPKLFIVFYSTYLHVYKLALAIKEGAEKAGQVDVQLYQIPETLPEEVLSKIHAPGKPDVPLITPSILKEADGVLFGFPTRFGTVPAQLKDFIDACGGLWATGAMNGKLGGIFNSTATQHGGQETTAFTFLTILAHFGMLYVPNGYSNSHLQEDQEVIGGSPWGATTIAGGDGSRQPHEKELSIATTQGENFASYLARFHGATPAVTEEAKVEEKTVEKVEEPVKAAPAVEQTTEATSSSATPSSPKSPKDKGVKGLFKRLSGKFSA